MRQLLSVPTWQLWSVLLAQEDSDYCEDPMKSQAGEVLLMIPVQTEQVVGKWGALLPPWGGSTLKTTHLKAITVLFQENSQVFLGCCIHCLDGKSYRHVTTVTSTAFPSTPSSCNALRRGPWQAVEITLIAPPAERSASLLQDHVCPPSLPATTQPSQGALAPLCSAFRLLLYFSSLLSFRNI